MFGCSTTGSFFINLDRDVDRVVKEKKKACMEGNLNALHGLKRALFMAALHQSQDEFDNYRLMTQKTIISDLLKLGANAGTVRTLNLWRKEKVSMEEIDNEISSYRNS